MKTVKYAALTAVLVAAFGSAQADVVGGQSFTEPGGVRVGKATDKQDNAGIGVDKKAGNKLMDSNHFARSTYLNNGVYQWSGQKLVKDGAPPFHSELGVWTFAKAGAGDVWFGEWDKEGAAVGSKVAGTHTVWYVGQNGDVATTKPKADGVTYAVRSINPKTTTATSTLTANFGSNTASSSGDINFGNGKITTAGNRVQLGATGVGVNSSGGAGGTLSGDFFGTGAAAVAGTVKFTDRNKDTAFGGTKNP